MALFSSLALQVARNNTQTVSQILTLDKRTIATASRFVSSNINKHWKKIAVVGAGCALVAGALKVRTEILKYQHEQSAAPTADKVENLTESVPLIEVGSELDFGILEGQDYIAELLSQELELSECLQIDETEIEMVKYVDQTLLKEAYGAENVVVKELLLEKIELIKKDRAKKRVRTCLIPQAVKAMVSKARASFPNPDGSQLQQKAIALYLAKEGRKLKIRESQLSYIIPKAVALSSIPTDAQIDARQIMKIESVKMRFNQMNWQGVKNQSSWLNKLVAVVSNAQ